MPRFWNDMSEVTANTVTNNFKMLLGNPNTDSVNYMNVGEVVKYSKNSISGDYATIRNLQQSGQLIPGQVYSITNYQCIYVQPVTNLVTTGDQVETLVLMAISSNQFAPQVWSLTRPFDMIGYDISNDTNKYGWAHNSGRGVIYSRTNQFNVSIPYDANAIRFRRYGVNAASLRSFSVGQNWSKGEIVANGAKDTVFICTRGLTSAGNPNSPANNTTEWVELLSNIGTNNTINWSPTPALEIPNIWYVKWVIPILASQHSDHFTFHDWNLDANTFRGSRNHNVKIEPFFDSDNVQQLNNIVFITRQPTNNFNDIYIGPNSYNNTFRAYVNGFYSEGEFQNNFIGQNMVNVYFERIAKWNFISANCTECTFGKQFNSNGIAQYFQNNRIGNEVVNSFFGTYVRNNTIGMSITHCLIPGNSEYNTLLGNSGNVKYPPMNYCFDKGFLSNIDMMIARNTTNKMYNVTIQPSNESGGRWHLWGINDAGVFKAQTIEN